MEKMSAFRTSRQSKSKRLLLPSSLQKSLVFLIHVQLLMILKARIPITRAFSCSSPYAHIRSRAKFGDSNLRRLRRFSVNTQTSLQQSSLPMDEIDFEESGFSFEVDSFDQKGKWMEIDWVERQKSFPSTFSPDTDFASSESSCDARIAAFSPEQPSPVHLSLVRDRMVYIKRDDHLQLKGSNVSGNKARKFLALNELPMEDFPDAIVSYGGPQSNAMLALAAIVNARNVELNMSEHDLDSAESLEFNEIENDAWFHDDNDLDDQETKTGDENSVHSVNSQEGRKRFIYYTKKLPRYLRKQPNGNLLRALALGMEIIEVSNDDYNERFGGNDGGSETAPSEIDPPVPMKSLWVPQGGFCGVATQGASLMADEVLSFWAMKGKGMPLTVCLPGGTCTTAMLLSREVNRILNEKSNEVGEAIDIQIAVIPCIGNAGYAKRQMKALDLMLGGNGRDDMPKILKPWKNSYPRFGEPTKELLDTFLEMKDEHGIYLDLLYGSPAWHLLLKYLTSQRDSPIKGRQVMYIHSGGLEGVSSQLTRYKHKGLIDASQIQI